MNGEKYVVATAQNSFHISVRNILNSHGYVFLGNSSDYVSLLRLIRSFQPDFAIIDIGMQPGELSSIIDTIDDEMLCACILVGNNEDMAVSRFLLNSKVVSFCPKPVNKELLVHTVEMANLNFRRVYELNKKLKEVTENLETRKLVERAKWILMERDNITENEAYEKMRKKSMDNRVSMKEIAEAIIIVYEKNKRKK